MTGETLAAIARIPHRFLRTSVHPSAHLVHDAVTFDDLYEQADTFDDVYAEIADRLVAAAAEFGEVIYVVPGSPLVLERSVRTLRNDPRIECVLLPAMSFLDLVWARLGDRSRRDRRATGRRARVRHRRGRSHRCGAGRPHTCQLGAVPDQVEHRRPGRAASTRPPWCCCTRSAPRTRRSCTRPGPRWIGRSRPTTSRACTSPRSRRRSPMATCASINSPERCASAARGTSSRPISRCSPT